MLKYLLLKFFVLGAGFLQDGDARIGILPNRKELLVGRTCLRGIALQSVGTRQTHVSECVNRHTNRIVVHYAPVAENLLKLRRRLGHPDGRPGRLAPARTPATKLE